MTQKYKVFIDNVQLFFVTEEIEGVQVLLGNYFPESFTQLLDSFSELKDQQIQLISKNPKRSLKQFFRMFNHIKAAGGLISRDKELLFIHRLGKWDLPKGKLEKKESNKLAAVREVREECGLLKKPKIVEKITNTYHAYEVNGVSYLKKTAWFLMTYDGLEKPIAQKEEGITSVCWVKPSALPAKLKKCYPSILDVIDGIS